MNGRGTKHERSIEEEITELVSTDLSIVAGIRRIAELKWLAGRPNSAEGRAAARVSIETITESVHRLRAFRAVVVDVILNYDKCHGRGNKSAAEEIDPILTDRSVVGELARAIDAEIRVLVRQHGAPMEHGVAEGRFNHYHRIEMLQSTLDLLRVNRLSVFPYIEGLVSDS